MFHKNKLHKYLFALAASVSVPALVIVFAFFIIPNQPSATVASAPSVVDSYHKEIDLGAGYRLELDAKGGQILAPQTNHKAVHKTAAVGNRTIDLGAGYQLELTSEGGKIVAPSRPYVYYKHIELGAGYTLDISGEGGRITSPKTVQNFLPQPAAKQVIDLGAGYQLVLSAGTGYIIAPTNPTKTQDQAAPIKKMDIGSGYWLVITQDGGKIVQGVP